jgi:hypothetical protein
VTEDFLSPWYLALSSDFGFSFSSEDREAARQKLYRARGEARDPDLASLSIVLPANSNEIWIVKHG